MSHFTCSVDECWTNSLELFATWFALRSCWLWIFSTGLENIFTDIFTARLCIICVYVNTLCKSTFFVLAYIHTSLWVVEIKSAGSYSAVGSEEFAVCCYSCFQCYTSGERLVSWSNMRTCFRTVVTWPHWLLRMHTGHISLSVCLSCLPTVVAQRAGRVAVPRQASRLHFTLLCSTSFSRFSVPFFTPTFANFLALIALEDRIFWMHIFKIFLAPRPPLWEDTTPSRTPVLGPRPSCFLEVMVPHLWPSENKLLSPPQLITYTCSTAAVACMDVCSKNESVPVYITILYRHSVVCVHNLSSFIKT